MRPTPQTSRDRRAAAPRGPYEIVVRGADGRPRFERFRDARTYRARLVALDRSDDDSFSIDEIARLLDS